jgi:hypothetical protein
MLFARMKKLYSWSEHIERCFASGLSKRAYCARHGISYQMFFYHQRKLLGNEALSGFEQVSVNSVRYHAFAESTGESGQTDPSIPGSTDPFLLFSNRAPLT